MADSDQFGTISTLIDSIIKNPLINIRDTYEKLMMMVDIISPNVTDKLYMLLANGDLIEMDKASAMKNSKYFEDIVNLYPTEKVFSLPLDFNEDDLKMLFKILKNPTQSAIITIDDDSLETIWKLSDYFQIGSIIDILKYRLLEYYMSPRFFYKYGTTMPTKDSLPGENILKSMVPMAFETKSFDFWNIRDAEYSPDGKYFAYIDDNIVELLGFNGQDVYRLYEEPVRVGVGELKRPFEISYSPNGKYLAFSLRPKTIIIFDMGGNPPKLFRKYQWAPDPTNQFDVFDDVIALTFNPGNTKLVAAGRKIRIWNLLSNTDTPAHIITDNVYEIYGIKYIPNSDYLVTWGQEENIKIWKTFEVGEPKVDKPFVFQNEISFRTMSLIISKDGHKLAFVDHANAYIMDTTTWTPSDTIGGYEDVLKILGFTDANTLLGLVELTDHVEVKSIADEKIINHYKKLIPGVKASHMGVKLSPNGTEILLFTSSKIKTIKIYDDKININQFILTINLLNDRMNKFTPYWLKIYDTLPPKIKASVDPDSLDLID